MTPDISLLVCLYEEEAAVPGLAERLRRAMPAIRTFGTVEILFVDDGSTDRTRERLDRAAADLGVPVRIVAHERNLGLGAALKTGVREAQGSWVVPLDADGTYDPEQIPALLRARDATNADIVVGSPYHPDGRTVGSLKWRIGLSRTLSTLYRGVAPIRLYTYTSMFRAQSLVSMRASVPPSDDFIAVTQWLVLAAERGFSIVEIPATLTVRTAGRSKMRVLRVGLAHLRYAAGLAAARLGSRRTIRAH